jgi:hypothetical protein
LIAKETKKVDKLLTSLYHHSTAWFGQVMVNKFRHRSTCRVRSRLPIKGICFRLLTEAIWWLIRGLCLATMVKMKSSCVDTVADTQESLEEGLSKDGLLCWLRLAILQMTRHNAETWITPNSHFTWPFSPGLQHLSAQGASPASDGPRLFAQLCIRLRLAFLHHHQHHCRQADWVSHQVMTHHITWTQRRLFEAPVTGGARFYGGPFMLFNEIQDLRRKYGQALGRDARQFQAPRERGMSINYYSILCWNSEYLRDGRYGVSFNWGQTGWF